MYFAALNSWQFCRVVWVANFKRKKRFQSSALCPNRQWKLWRQKEIVWKEIVWKQKIGECSHQTCWTI